MGVFISPIIKVERVQRSSRRGTLIMLLTFYLLSNSFINENYNLHQYFATDGIGL